MDRRKIVRSQALEQQTSKLCTHEERTKSTFLSPLAALAESTAAALRCVRRLQKVLCTTALVLTPWAETTDFVECIVSGSVRSVIPNSGNAPDPVIMFRYKLFA